MATRWTFPIVVLFLGACGSTPKTTVQPEPIENAPPPESTPDAKPDPVDTPSAEDKLRAAPDTFIHEKSAVAFPASLGDFVRGNVKEYDDTRYGVSANYDMGDHRLSLYAYDEGRPQIDDGIESVPVRETFRDAADAIKKHNKGQVDDLGSSTAYETLPGTSLAALHAAFALRWPKGLQHSALIVSACNGHLLKVRYTGPASDLDAGSKALRSALDIWVQANQTGFDACAR